MFPFLDLQDQNNISANDLWGNFSDTILLASKRYQSQAALSIRLYQKKSGLWHSNWTLLLLGENQSWTASNKNRAQALASGIDQLADQLAKQFTSPVSGQNDIQGSFNGQPPEDRNSVLIQVNNVSDFREFQKLDEYFNNLASVKSVILKQLEHDRLIYKINYLGEKKSLIREIKLGDRLNSIERSGVDNSFNGDKDYQAVILDNLDNPVQKKNSDLESSQNALQKLPEQQLSKEQLLKKSAAEIEQPKVIEELLPELEYWLVR